MFYETAKAVVAEWLERGPIEDLVPRRHPSTEIPPKGSTLALVGARRAGKTYLLYQMAKDADKEGSSLLVDLEDYRLTSLAPDDIELLLRAHTEFRGQPPTHLFLDEIHALPQWSRVLRTLCNRRKYHVVVSGSNAALVEREISKELRGRYASRLVYPLSFAEYLDFTGRTPEETAAFTEKAGELTGALREYLRTGGFPEVVLADTALRRGGLLTSYFRTVFFCDLVERYGIQSTALLHKLMEHLITNFSSKFSISRFTGRTKAEGTAASKKTVSAFLDHLEDVFFLRTCPICDPSAHRRRMNPRKAYLIDHGFASISQLYGENRGLLLENAVALELMRRRKELCYFHGQRECDFLVGSYGKPNEAIQVCWELDNRNRNREISGLNEASTKAGVTQRKIVTADQVQTIDQDGSKISVVPAWQWMLQRNTASS